MRKYALVSGFLMILPLLGLSQDSTRLRVIDYEGKKWMLMDIDLARERAILLDKGFEYYKLYKLEQKKSAAQDSIIDLQQQQIDIKESQNSNLILINHNSEKQAMNNLDLANLWKGKARKRSVRIVLAGVGGLVIGYLAGK